MLLQSVVDQSWTRPAPSYDGGGFWLVPLVIIAIVLVAAAVSRRPWVMLALGLSLIVIVPIGSCVTR